MKLFVCFLFLLNFNFASAADAILPPQPCTVDQHWVRAYHRRAYFRADGTPVRESFVKAHCQNNPKSYKLWRDKLKNVRPTNWPDANAREKLKNWSDEEIERVLEALNDLPEILWVEAIQSISRMDKSVHAGNSGSGTPGHIVLYDDAFVKDKNLARIISHELAHAYYNEKLTKDGKREFNTMNGWYTLEESDVNWKSVGRIFVEPDGDLSPEEDFTNNIEYYLFNKAKLRSVTPTAVEWIQHHFGDKLKLEKR